MVSNLKILSKPLTNFIAEDNFIPSAKVEKDLTVSIRINEEPQKHVLESEQEVDVCEIIVEMMPLATLEEVQLVICSDESFVVFPEICFYSILQQKELAHFVVYCKKEKNVNSLQIDVIIAFTTNTGIPKVLQQTVRLPFKLVAITCNPQKETAHKVVLCMNQSSVPLNEIFSGTCTILSKIKIYLILFINRIFCGPDNE